MARMHERLEFPCGLKIEVSGRSFFMWSSFKLDEYVCPLHGKGCKKVMR
jgi:hypothetical protein